MNTIYILGYNNLGVDFWSNHLDIKSTDRVLFFRNGKSLLNHLKKQPDMIIVDEYFSCSEIEHEHNFDDMKIGLPLVCPQIVTFFFSPSFTGKPMKSTSFSHYYSNFNDIILDYANSAIRENRKSKKAA